MSPASHSDPKTGIFSTNQNFITAKKENSAIWQSGPEIAADDVYPAPIPPSPKLPCVSIADPRWLSNLIIPKLKYIYMHFVIKLYIFWKLIESQVTWAVIFFFPGGGGGGGNPPLGEGAIAPIFPKRVFFSFFFFLFLVASERLKEWECRLVGWSVGWSVCLSVGR